MTNSGSWGACFDHLYVSRSCVSLGLGKTKTNLEANFALDLHSQCLLA